MKKFNILLMGALALAFAACDETTPTVPPIQSNPQGPVLETSNVYGEVEGPIAQGVLNLENYRENPLIELYKLDSIVGIPANTVTSLQLEISNTDTFNNARTIDTDCDSTTYSVDAFALNDAHTAIFGKSSKERDVYYRILGFVTSNGTSFRIGGTDHYIASGTYKGQAFEMGIVEYLCTPGDANGWSQSASSWLRYNEGKEYNCGALLASGKLKFTDGDSWDDDKTWGDDGTVSGLLAQPGENIDVASSGLYWAIANIDEGTYSIVPVTSVGIVGGLNGWSESNPIELTSNADQSVWSGDVDLTGDWKIVINYSWDSNYGGSIDEPVVDGGNFSGYEGSYHVSVDFSGNYPMITLTEK